MFKKMTSLLILLTALALGLAAYSTSSAMTQSTVSALANEQVVEETANQTVTAPLESSDLFFDDSYVHEIYLTFDEDDYGAEGWYNTLYDSHANNADDPYFPASFSGDGVTIDTVGVRFKGNSSFNVNSVKKSFKIDFDEYDEDNDELVFYDLKKLNLNNGFKDPTLLREKLFLDFADDFVAAPRAVHVKVYVNGEYYGLYTAVEQIDKTFVQNRFGDDEDGNLFKGTASNAVDPQDDFGSDLTWLGSDPEAYYDYYALKTNETANDYSQLIAFIDVLNNTAPADFPTNLEPLFDVDEGLQGLALNNLFVNLDSYNGAAHNFYVYDRDDTGQITHILWDANESFGRFLRFTSPGQDPLELDPFWLPASMPGQGEEERPLMENLWANEDYSNDYLCALTQMLDSGFDEATMEARIDQLADLIRADLYADPNKLYTNTQFESNLYNNIQEGMGTIYGLRYLVEQRAAYLQTELANYTLDCAPEIPDLSGTLFINEFMADNETILEDPDEPGDYPDWIELYNAGTTDIDLQGLYLTDDLTDPTQHAITQTLIVPAGGYLLLYADNDTEQGANHIGFQLGASGEDIAIFNSDDSTLIDSYTFGEQTADISEGRCPDGGEMWLFFGASTPGASNEPCAAGPVMTNVSHSPTSPTASDVVMVTAVITDDVAINSAVLWYSIGGSYTAITMTNQSSLYTALIPAQVDDTTVNYYLEADDNEGFTTTEPANAPTSTYSYIVGYEAPTLYLNELMADNETILEDPDEPGDYPDWIELYNPGSETIDLGGLYLTDDLTDSTQFQIPDGVTIAGGGFLLFYADGDTEQGNQHPNFGLSANGESVALFGADGVTQIDAVTFMTQTTDVAYGRQTNGTGSWGIMSQATPGNSNVSAAGPVITNVSHLPTSPTASDVVTVTAVITDDVAINSALLWYSIGGSYTAITMTNQSSLYMAVIPAQADETTVNYYIEADDNQGFVTTEPANAPTSTYSYVVGYEAPLLYINELMADNQTILEDPDEPGDYPDWIELYNAGTTDIDLQGVYLTDDLTDPTQHAITQTLTVPAGGYLLLVADNDTEQGANHLGFNLSASGEDIAIFASDGATLIDSYTFGEQTTDTSEGRCPDGGDTWTFFTSSTLGASNEPCGTAPVISNIAHLLASPTSSDDVTVTAIITDDVTIDSATLWYSVGGSYIELTMTDEGSNVYAATIPAQADGTTVNYYIEADDNEGFTTTEPANAPTNTYSYMVGYEAPTLYVNELMADNETILEDPDEPGDYPDWIELYNPGSETIDLGGLYLTDNLTDPTQFPIPDGVTIAGGGFLLFYADGNTDQGNQHLNFGLSANGESVALFGADGVTQIDAVTFTTQTTDVAYGRQTDGTGSWGIISQATPGNSNVSSGSLDNYIYLPMVINQ